MIAPGPLSFIRGSLQSLQAAFVVRDLEESMRHYHRLLGTGPWSVYTYDSKNLTRASYRGRKADYAMRVALAACETGSIELIQHLAGDSIYADFIRAHGSGFHHFGITVEDAGRALAEAARAGLAVSQDGYGFGAEGDGCFAYLDSLELLGVVLEIRELPRKRRPPERIFPADRKDGR